MAAVYFRACLALLMVCAAVATTADDGIGPGERVDKRLNPAIPMPTAAVMANVLMNVGALRFDPTDAEASLSGEPIELGFVLLSSIDRYIEDAIERPIGITSTLTSPWSEFAKLHRALAAGVDAEVIQAYWNGTCGGDPINIIYWGQDEDRGAENITGKLRFGSFKRSHDSPCETVYVDAMGQ